jgi:hypothetical protein
MFRFGVFLFMSVIFIGASADICSQLYNENGVAFHYEVLGKGYSLRGYERSQIFTNGLDYHYRLLGGSLHVRPDGVFSDKLGHFSYNVYANDKTHKKHCTVVYVIAISH